LGLAAVEIRYFSEKAIASISRPFLKSGAGKVVSKAKNVFDKKKKPKKKKRPTSIKVNAKTEQQL